MSICFDQVTTLLRLAFTISGFLVASASFIIGLYLSELKTFPQRAKVMPFVWLAISLILFPAVLVVWDFVIVLLTPLNMHFTLYLLTLSLAPAVPIVAIIYILSKHRPMED